MFEFLYQQSCFLKRFIDIFKLTKKIVKFRFDYID